VFGIISGVCKVPVIGEFHLVVEMLLGVINVPFLL